MKGSDDEAGTAPTDGTDGHQDRDGEEEEEGAEGTRVVDLQYRGSAPRLRGCAGGLRSARHGRAVRRAPCGRRAAGPPPGAALRRPRATRGTATRCASSGC